MNILQFKNSTQWFMQNNRAFRWYKKMTSNIVWCSLVCACIGAYTYTMLALGINTIPPLPFEGKELNDALSIWRIIVFGKMALGMMVSLMPLAVTGMILDWWARRALRKEGLNLLVPEFNQILEKASEEDKRAVMETALKLEGAAHYKDIEDLQECAKETLPKAWWKAVHTHLQETLHNETVTNPTHPCRTPQQDRFSNACSQLANRARQVSSPALKV